MTTIDDRQSIATLINVFNVSLEKADELVGLLNDATTAVMVNIPGFISANIHKSFDGTRVINYAQWRSQGEFEAMRNNPQAMPHMKAAADLAEKYEPMMCEVVSVHGG